MASPSASARVSSSAAPPSASVGATPKAAAHGRLSVAAVAEQARAMARTPSSGSSQKRPGPEQADSEKRARTAQEIQALGQAKSILSGKKCEDTFIVYSTGRDKEEAVKTILGEYIARGTNHDRQVYQKVHDRKAPGGINVLLYYWDSRDGPDFAGWWFGNKLGGSQVWSHCQSNAMSPPESGWRIPYDGQIRSTIHVVTAEARERAAMDSRMRDFIAEVSKLEHEIGKGVELAQRAISDDSLETFGAQALAEQAAVLERQRAAAAELLQKVRAATESTPMDQAELLADMESRLLSAQQEAEQAFDALGPARELAQDVEDQLEAEGADEEVLQQMLMSHEHANRAEDLVEAAAVAFEMMASYDDEDMIRQAMEDTDKAAKEAQRALNEARTRLDAKLVSLHQLRARASKERASTELGALRQRLTAAQKRLTPLRGVRQDWERRRAAQRLAAEGEEQLARAEAEVAKAEEAISVLQHRQGSCDEDTLGDTLAQLQAAEAQVDKVCHTLEKDATSSGGTISEDLHGMQKRGSALRSRLRELRSSYKEATERIAVHGVSQEAASRMASVTEAIEKLEAECALLGEDSDVNGAASEVNISDGNFAGAQTAISTARMFFQMKMIEARRFSQVVESEATSELLRLQKQLEQASERLSDMKGEVSRRRARSIIREVEAVVSKAEDSVASMCEASAWIEDDAAVSAMATEQIRQAAAQITKMERQTADLILEARRFLSTKTIEVRSKLGSVEVPTELSRFQSRLAECQAQVSKHRRLPGAAEQRLAGRKALAEAERQLRGAEEKVGSARAAFDRLEEAEDVDSNSQKEVELLVQEAQILVRTVARFFEAQMRLHGSARDEFEKLSPRVYVAQANMVETSGKCRERSQLLLSRSILRDATREVDECETAVEEAVAAESQLVESRDSRASDEEAAELTLSLDTAVQAAITCASNARTMLSMKRITAQRLTESVGKSTAEALDELQGRAEAATQKLTEMRSRTASQRRSVLRKEVLSK